MKTLKRSLALILVVVMALGVFAVSASAAELVDMDKVNYTEAVAVINGMGIITGDENGVFDPQGEISRAGAAKLIAYITLGKTLADSLSTNVAPFPDVPAGEWYAGYVNYCAGQGFINGDENGNFNPDDSISGYGYAKLGRQGREELADVVRDYIHNSEQMQSLFVLIDSRYDIVSTDLDFIAELGEYGIPFSIIFTKCDKQGPNALAAQIEKDKEILSADWEELPLMFCSSSHTGMGRDEILDYIDSILKSL